ncbi:MAG: crotonobetaine/carnitine-CoA ligase [Berryella intestinalis]|uniref:crotonobetaine/carnitine-CoA ligase n=1 Tax=Berryella intestinalis TaxID=1531429 RepID=UPI002A549FF2|nr:crotonobetaine/carnitine-CoA ligase [Berryella intestinalis]MDD7368821.1 crotonobetaine/carnitine-CoA ligase [Berryella intestinalis]MDY3129015.1 crotonobetaine/carnitine-CoA ligase [Berryella intestinalis]
MADIVGNDTLRSLWDRLERDCGDREFLVFQDRWGSERTYTYRAFNREIDRTANLFLSLGVEREERVAVQMRTCPEFIMCLFGLAKIGAVMVPMNEQYLADEVAYALERTGATFAVAEGAFAGIYRDLCDRRAIAPERVLIARRGGDGCEGGVRTCESGPLSACGQSFPGDGACGDVGDGFSDFDCARAAQPAELGEVSPLSSDDVAEIMFTSGTTARPKGVVLTHANMLFSGVYGAWEVSLGSQDRLLTTMPACHSNFQLAALTPVLAAGATLIVVERYSARRFWSQIRGYRATVTQCVAMMLRTLLLQPVDPAERDHCLRTMLYFLAVSDDEKERFEKRYRVSLANTYGSTESVGWVLTDPPTGQHRWPSVGRPGLGYEVRIVRDDGRPAAAYEVGEIQVLGVRGRTVMRGYFDDPDQTARAFTADGWMRTGDKGYRDDEGWFFFVDRKSNMIKRAGENISASEIERVLVQHPDIDEAAVIGVPDPIRDQAVKAFVKPVAGRFLTEGEVVSFCAERMAAFKVPSFVQIVGDFPRTCSMKIEKKLLH